MILIGEGVRASNLNSIHGQCGASGILCLLEGPPAKVTVVAAAPGADATKGAKAEQLLAEASRRGRRIIISWKHDSTL